MLRTSPTSPSSVSLSSSHSYITLFPYTTLFRSSAYRLSSRLGRLRWLQNCGGRCRVARPWRSGRATRQRPPQFCSHLRDRKSTRLNSSHVSISYAVFCLKKKKETFAEQSLVLDC